MALTRPPVVNPFANTVAGTPSDFWDVPVTYDAGFTAPGGDPVKPELSDVNWLFWLVTLGVRYLLSRAFTPWDSTETQYTAGSMVRDSDGTFYVLVGSATTGTHPNADNNWNPLNMLDRVPTPSNGGDWVRKVARWMTPRGDARFALDRWALPEGAYYQHREIWTPSVAWAVGGSFGQWNFIGTGGSSLVIQHPPGVSAGVNAVNTSPSLELTIDSGVVNNRIMARFDSLSLLSADALTSALFESAFVNDTANFSYVMGFASTVDGAVNNIQNGAFFYALPGTANWQAKSVNGGASSAVDTGVVVAAGTGGAHDFRVVLAGSGMADDVVPHALFYIDGFLVANVTTNVPNSSGSPVSGEMMAGGWLSGSTGGSNKSMVLGPATYTQATKAATS